MLNIAGQLDYRVFSEKSDVWSFGMFMCELAQKGEDPFKDLSEEEVTKKLLEVNDYMPSCPSDDLKPFFEHILIKCWSRNPMLRPTFQELDELLFNYFDLCETKYKFEASSSHKAECNRIDEWNPDQICLGTLIKSGSISETWIGRKLFDYLTFINSLTFNNNKNIQMNRNVLQ